jgi:hypothetical protein
MKERVVQRLDELKKELEDLESGKESYGDSDEQEVALLNARIEELTWVVGLFPN